MSDEEMITEEEKKERYYQRRILRPKNWRQLHRKVLQTFSKTTIVLILLWFHDFLVQQIDDPNASVKHLPGNIFDWCKK